jgi:hypothetical protein
LHAIQPVDDLAQHRRIGRGRIRLDRESRAAVDSIEALLT